MHFHLQLCTVAAVVTFWGSSRFGFLPSPNYLNSWSGSFLLSSSIQPMLIPLLHHLSQLLSSELSVVKLQPLFFASISSELPGNLYPHTGSRLFLLFLPCFFLPVSWFCLPAIFLYRIRLYQQTDLSYTRSRKLYLNTSIYLSFSL